MDNTTVLNPIINDFLFSKKWQDGYGLLKDHPSASEFSRQVNDRQRRRYVKFGRVPMPFIFFLKSIGVRFAKSDEEMRGITVRELEAILTRSESGHSQCAVSNESFKSILKHLEFECLMAHNPELKGTYRLIGTYTNEYEMANERQVYNGK